MCGISGILDLNGKSIPEKDIKSLNRSIIHRGPDAEGQFIEENIAIAHRRLSIIDLNNFSNQPFFYKERYVISYNGEIYNYIEIRNQLKSLGYSFETNSDTEVLIKSYAEWGRKCLDKLNGMWAFAIWDRKEKRLFCSRDRFGIKPLYWSKKRNKVYFSSEIKQLRDLNLGNYCNYDELSIFIYSGCANSSNETFYRDINSLNPGHYLIIERNGSIKIEPWYDLRKKICKLDNKFDSRDFKYHLINSIKLRLRSDVRIGTSLSGGLDSSSVIKIASELLEKTFENDKLVGIHAKSTDLRFDESKFAESACKGLDVDLYKVQPTYQDFLNAIREMVYFQDEPFASANNLMQYSVMKKAKSLDVKVMLDGQGSDEILFGYNRAFLITLFAYFGKSGLLGTFKHIINSLNNNAELSFISMLKYLIGNLNGFARSRYLANRMRFINLSPEPTEYLFNEVSRAKNNPIEYQIIEIEKTSLPQILRTEDRNSMAHSVEARIPFLDFNLVEYCLGLEVTEKVKKGWTKFPLRSSNILNKDIAWRKSKLGFDGPEVLWDKNFAPFMLKKVQKSLFINQISDIKKLSNAWFGLSAKERWRIFNVCLWQEINNVN